MSTPLTDNINALTTYINETTGANDTTLSDAVETLVTGYGQGRGFEVIDRFSFSEDTLEYTFTHSGPGLYVFCEEPILTRQKAIEDNRRDGSLFSGCFSLYGVTTLASRAGTSLVYRTSNQSVDYWGTGVSLSGNDVTIKIASSTSANLNFEAGINYMILKMST